VRISFEPKGEQRLLDFAPQRAFGRQEQVLGELLGERRAALDGAPGAQVGPRGAGDPPKIEAEVLVEAAVLGGDDGEREFRRQLRERDRLAPDRADARDFRSVGGEHDHRRRARRAERALDIGQVVGEIGERAEGDDRAPDQNGERAGDGAAATSRGHSGRTTAEIITSPAGGSRAAGAGFRARRSRL
jgi:hypothetical protein